MPTLMCDENGDAMTMDMLEEKGCGYGGLDYCMNNMRE